MWQQVEGAGAVGMVGFGLMEHPMAANILRSGFAVHITGRIRDKYRDLIEAGVFWHNTPGSLANAVTVLVLMLPDLLQVEEVLAGSDGILACSFSDLLLIIASTSSPIEVRRLGRRLARGTDGRVRVIDTPYPAAVRAPKPAHCRSWSVARSTMSTTPGRCSPRVETRFISDHSVPARWRRRATR